jgi:hypothetical protein
MFRLRNFYFNKMFLQRKFHFDKIFPQRKFHTTTIQPYIQATLLSHHLCANPWYIPNNG